MSTLTVKELSHPAGEVIKIAAGKTLDLNSQGSVTMPTGSVLQTVYLSQDTAISTSSVMNYHSAAPTISQGAQILTTSFTPKSSSSTIIFWFTTTAYSSGVHNAIFSLFDGSTSIGVTAPRHQHASEAQQTILIMCKSANSNTTARTYSVRGGCQAGNSQTVHINTYPAYAGIPQTSLCIQEIAG